MSDIFYVFVFHLMQLTVIVKDNIALNSCLEYAGFLYLQSNTSLNELINHRLFRKTLSHLSRAKLVITAFFRKTLNIKCFHCLPLSSFSSQLGSLRNMYINTYSLREMHTAYYADSDRLTSVGIRM